MWAGHRAEVHSRLQLQGAPNRLRIVEWGKWDTTSQLRDL